MQPVIYYEGERIYFRPIEVEDAPLLQRWVNDPRVWSTMGMRGPINAAYERQWIEGRKPTADDYMFGIVVKQTHQLVGACGLHRVCPINRKATLGIMIGEVDQQNQGYGREAVRLVLRFAFEELNLHRVELAVFDHNPRAIRVYERAGFELEGRFREAAYRHGRYHDELRYAVLRSKWLASNNQASRRATLPEAGAAEVSRV